MSQLYLDFPRFANEHSFRTHTLLSTSDAEQYEYTKKYTGIAVGIMVNSFSLVLYGLVNLAEKKSIIQGHKHFALL